MENINFRGIPTSLFLNGPKVGIVTDPQSVPNVTGFATFTGIATATYNSIMYSNDLTSPGALKTKTDGFNGTLSGRSEGVGGLTFTPIPPISYSSSVEVYDNNNVTKGRINGGSYVQHATDSFVTIASGSGIITTMDFLRTDSGGVDAGFVAIRVDGNILKDADTNFALDGGSVAFNWYFDGSRILDTSEDSNSNAEIVGFSSATGTGSTITINGLTLDDNGKEVYFEAEYVPSAYQTTPPVTAGTARSTGNAFNEPLQSGIGTITVKPIIEITSQPEGQVVGQTFEASYSIAARTTPGNGPVQYQWQLNGNDLSNGTSTTTVNTAASGQLEVTDANGRIVDVVDFGQVSSYSGPNKRPINSELTEESYTLGQTYTLKSSENITTKLLVFGAGGGGSDVRSVRGSRGGVSEGTFTFIKDQEYKLIVGSAGDRVTAGLPGGGTGGGTRGSSGRGGGGGYTGLFEESITHANAIIIAGGGGGSTGDVGFGGAGGGTEGADGSNGNRAGLGGSQNGGGAGKGSSGSGSALQGGNGDNAGAGGGGYYGGGGGNPSGTISDGAGGGGSGYIHPTLITDGRTIKRSEDQTNFPGGTGRDGEFRIEILSSTKTVTTTISGANTENLSITTDDSAAGVIRCKVTADDVQESPVFSGSVSYYVVGKRNVVKIEQYNYSNESVIFSENNLSNGSLSISYDTHPGNAICLYAGEQDINVEVDMYGGKGSDNGSNSGGEGGYSKIRFTMKKDEEYILTGLFPAVNAPFLYRKASVIAIVGGGGMAGVNGNGGLGGGIGVSGSDGKGRGGGHAPTAIGPGEGGQRARFGSKFDGEALTGGLIGDDHQATGVEGGDSAPCPRGIYWRNQGKSPCEDLGITKFRSPDGTVMDRSNQGTAEIDRGYKSGYNAIQTAGAGETAQSGDGGNGYSGGWGGQDGGGGGGAYGYTDGSVTVVSTTQGGSTGPARINIKLSTGNFFIDGQGRILIFSTNDNRDPRTLTKTTSVVNYGDNTCIDDARWQRFLDLARDGTQDYRLTATENNSTTKITNATEKNIYKMMNGNALTLRDSLTGWVDSNYAYQLLALAWDETSNDGMSGYGSDYSILSWSPTASYGYGFYGSSSSPFFNPTVYGYKSGVDLWILPPGVPDF